MADLNNPKVQKILHGKSFAHLATIDFLLEDTAYRGAKPLKRTSASMSLLSGVILAR